MSATRKRRAREWFAIDTKRYKNPVRIMHDHYGAAIMTMRELNERWGVPVASMTIFKVREVLRRKGKR
jgi:hypothetical protein